MNIVGGRLLIDENCLLCSFRLFDKNKLSEWSVAPDEFRRVSIENNIYMNIGL